MDFNLFALDDNGQDIQVEETPVIDDPADDVYTTGNTMRCYCCDRRAMDGVKMVRKDYSRAANPRREIKAAQYFLTLCVWCDYAHRVSRRTLAGS